MKTLQIATIAALFIGFTSCSSDDDLNQAVDPVESQLVTNLEAPQTGGQGQPVGGAFTKFDFATGMETNSDTD